MVSEITVHFQGLKTEASRTPSLSTIRPYLGNSVSYFAALAQQIRFKCVLIDSPCLEPFYELIDLQQLIRFVNHATVSVGYSFK